MISARHIVKRVRRQLDQVPMTGEDVKTDSATLGSPSTNFSDENLLSRINSAQREIATEVKAQHIPQCIKRYDGPFPSITGEVVRLLYSRVHHGGEGNTGEETEWTFYDPSDYFEGQPEENDLLFSMTMGRRTNITGLSISTDETPSSSSPFRVYKNGILIGNGSLEPSGIHDSEFQSTWFGKTDTLYVRLMGETDAEGVHITFSGQTEVIVAEEVTNYRAVQRNVDRHRRLERAGRKATAQYPVYTYEDEQLNVYPESEDAYVYCVFSPEDVTPRDLAEGTDELAVDERFEAAVVFRVVASCYQTLRKTGLHSWSYNRFREEIDPYSLNNRFNGIIDDRESDIL